MKNGGRNRSLNPTWTGAVLLAPEAFGFTA
jgi:hypothetical protein